MVAISKKTLKDLELNRVLAQVKDFAISELAVSEILKITPISDSDVRQKALQLTDEYLSSFENDNRIPNHYFYDISKAIHLLGIENAFITPKGFNEIDANMKKWLTLNKFFKKFKDIYPHLFKASSTIPFEKVISELVVSKITKYAEVADHASPILDTIRKEIQALNSKISVSFERDMNRYVKAGYLDEIRETIVEGRRVLAVQAAHRKKVKGSLLGKSKTGSIVYIAPETISRYFRELDHLELDEKDEVLRVLKELTDDLRPYRDILILSQQYFIALDVVGAKAKYALSIRAILPRIVKEKKLFLRDAYHPLLWVHNQKENIQTIPQTIELNEKQQIIVISGPNAGGKSITLKTIGLLQVMLQSGLLIPVHEMSEISFFDTILTDIGDNQSIENQLSTYSYRLKNMRIFLKKCNADTLFLIDEFGTGSDPELGGALAEVFLQEFYNKKSFGVITTHYANLKVLADELEFAVNANMQFDKRSHQPLFELVLGQAGSSFTFEVAIQNGIPYSLINQAKKRVSRSKIRLDKTISKLQSERNKMQRESQFLEKEKSKASEKVQALSDKQDKIQVKLEQFQTLYDSNQKMLQFGRDINELLHMYFQTNNKKRLHADFDKWVTAEKVKHTKKNPPKKRTKSEKKRASEIETKKRQKLKQTENEVLQKVKKVRERKLKVQKEIAKAKIDYKYGIGDIVRLIDGNAQGTVDKIEGKKLIINYGIFTTQVSKEQVELIRKVKKNVRN